MHVTVMGNVFISHGQQLAHLWHGQRMWCTQEASKYRHGKLSSVISGRAGLGWLKGAQFAFLQKEGGDEGQVPGWIVDKSQVPSVPFRC